MDCLWSDEFKYEIFVGNHEHHVLRAKEERDLPACYQRSVQKPVSLMVRGCIHEYGSRRVQVLNWPTRSPDLSPIENIWRTIKQKIRQRWPQTLLQLETYQARIGPISNTKTPETHNLDAQTSLNCFEKKRCYSMVNMPLSQIFWNL